VENKSDKSNVVALLLYVIVGPLGAHRFYVGKIGTGVAQLLSCVVPVVLAFQLMTDSSGNAARPMAVLALAILAGLVVWVLVDGVQILRQKFTDSEGNTLKFS
jgi:hypothetical protein